MGEDGVGETDQIERDDVGFADFVEEIRAAEKVFIADNGHRDL